jgi:hypothetical protein
MLVPLSPTELSCQVVFRQGHFFFFCRHCKPKLKQRCASAIRVRCQASRANGPAVAIIPRQ